MDGDRKTEAEFTIGRSGERDQGSRDPSSRGASGAPPRGQARQADFDLGQKEEREADTAIPERLRRKYYVAEAGSRDEAKVYADPKGEYLAFKVTSVRMATRLEDAGVIRDMVSIAQHRSWKEVELRGSEEFRRTAWLEASARGISVRGYEPDPIDRAALAFKTKPNPRSTRAPSQGWQREAEASETDSVGGVSTKRPIDVTVLPPERSRETTHRRDDQEAQFQSLDGSHLAARTAAEPPSLSHAVTIDVIAFKAEVSSESTRTAGRQRAIAFHSGDHREIRGDNVVKAAGSQLAAIEGALNKAVQDPALRKAVLGFAKDRITQQLERGSSFERMRVREILNDRQRATASSMAHLARGSSPRGRTDLDR